MDDLTQKQTCLSFNAAWSSMKDRLLQTEAPFCPGPPIETEVIFNKDVIKWPSICNHLSGEEVEITADLDERLL